VEAVYPSLSFAIRPPMDPPGSELTARGRDVRGVYVPYPRLRSWSPQRLASWARQIGADAVIMDVKDDHGRVTFRNDLPLAKGSPHGEVRHMNEILSVLRQDGIYSIGRLVCFKDDNLARVRPAEALRHRRTGAVWRDRGDFAWVDPHSHVAHEHIATVARAAQEIGFDEVQLDYVRFPVESGAINAVFPRREGDPKRHEVIASLLSRVDRAISIPLSIDVFGLTAYHPGDADGLGQSLEHLAPYIDAISPMVYLANWPRRFYENPTPASTHALVNGAVRAIRRRLGDGVAVRPLLQAFAWRAKGFGTPFIHNQIDAAVAGGSSGYLFWNQSANYQRVQAAFSQLDRQEVRSIPVISRR
ncbi:MAG TPA: putative glycoside hydrolase, partial [Polyangia bacterium]|nr:putative glycoside hydrolase [Polyangia bacterium]